MRSKSSSSTRPHPRQANIKPHYLYTGARTHSPDVIVSIDTETVTTDDGARRRQVLRCWAAATRVRHNVRAGYPEPMVADGDTAAGLCDLVESAAEVAGEAWVFAHNLGFDLTVTALPFVLVERGWALSAFNLGDESCWWTLEQEDRRLILTDSWSWLRCPLEDAARDIGKRKRKLPGDDAPLREWLLRCRRDVAILDQVMTHILDWWDDQQLGRFGITGASCGWSAMKQFAPPRTVLVGPDGDRTLFERRAIYGGRKEVYRVGTIEGSWCADYDFVSAYQTTAASFPLPVRPARTRAPAGPLEREQDDPRFDILGEIEVTTRRPCVPCRIGDDVWWPVGTFRTVLAGPEIRYAATVADRVDVVWCRWYQLGDALAPWAAWCAELADGAGRGGAGITGRLVRSWGRSVLGRFAGRTSRVVYDRPATRLGWHLETGHDLRTGVDLEVITVGGRELTIRKDLDAGDCSPVVLAFVEAHCRVALGRALEQTSPVDLLACNTDGWWQRVRGRLRGVEAAGDHSPYRVTRKAVERRVRLLGPNHVVTPSERRLSGVPAAALEDDAGRYRFHEWPGMRWQLEHGDPGVYVQPERLVALADNYARRWVLEDGQTIPCTVRLDQARQPVLEPWSRTWGRRPGDRLAGVQVDGLARLADTTVSPDWATLPELPAQPGRTTITEA